MLSRELFLSSFQRRYRDVETPAGTVRIQNLTEGERADLEAGAVTADGKVNVAFIRAQRRRLVAAVLVDENGRRLLNQPGDVDRLKDVDAQVIAAIWDAAQEHCGLAQAEELEKNSDEAAGGDSPTD